jgi:hypothetical protein
MRAKVIAINQIGAKMDFPTASLTRIGNRLDL